MSGSPDEEDAPRELNERVRGEDERTVRKRGVRNDEALLDTLERRRHVETRAGRDGHLIVPALGCDLLRTQIAEDKEQGLVSQQLPRDGLAKQRPRKRPPRFARPWPVEPTSASSLTGGAKAGSPPARPLPACLPSHRALVSLRRALPTTTAMRRARRTRSVRRQQGRRGGDARSTLHPCSPQAASSFACHT